MYGKTQEFEIGVGLHKDSALRPFLFVVVLDTLTEQIGMQGIWELLYADDLVIMAKTKEDLRRRIFEWQNTENSMERGRLKVNVDKTEIMVSAKRGREKIIVVEDTHHNSSKQLSRKVQIPRRDNNQRRRN